MATAEVTGISAEGLRGYGRAVAPDPVPDPTAHLAYGFDFASAGSLLYTGDRTTTFGNFASLAVVPWRHLELGAQYRALDTRNTNVRPGVLKVRGDALYSAKLAQRFGAFSLGGLVQARRYIGESTPAFAAYALGGYETGAWSFALQSGWIGERSVSWVRSPSEAERFAWRKSAWNAIALRTAAAYRLPAWTPYFELSHEFYTGVGIAWSRQPKRAALGAHVASGLEGVTLSPRIEAALGRGEGPGIPTETPWRLGMLVSYEPPVRDIWKRLFPPPGSFAAVVTNVAHGYPVPNARARMNGRELSADKSGLFLFEGPAGNYVITLDAPGYVPVTAAVTIEPGQYKAERFGMRRNAGVVRGFVFLGENQRGRADIKVLVPELNFESDPVTGAFSFELPPDGYAFTVTAPGFLPEKRSVVVKLGKEVVFDRLVLKPAPIVRAAPPPPPMPAAEMVTAPVAAPVAAPAPPPAVEPPPKAAPLAPSPTPVMVVETDVAKVKKRIVEEEQEVERRQWPTKGELPDRLESPVFFEFNSWKIDPRAYPALDRLAEMIKADTSIERVVIEGRADVVGSADANRFVAGKRADAIFVYLESRGVARDRLASTTTVYQRRATGQSDTQRAQDRRVGFRVEREE